MLITIISAIITYFIMKKVVDWLDVNYEPGCPFEDFYTDD